MVHLANKLQFTPFFVIVTVCYSIGSSNASYSPVILSNSSIQHNPKSLRIRAPASKELSPSLFTAAVKPAVVVALPLTILLRSAT